MCYLCKYIKAQAVLRFDGFGEVEALNPKAKA